MMLTLQIASNGCPNGAAPDAITLQAEVVRTYEDGMGLRFLLHAVGDRRLLLQFLARWQAHAKPPNSEPKTLRASSQGQSLIEFLFLFPLLFLLVVNVVNFGTFMYAWITVANAARAGSQYWITGGATIFAPSTPTEAQVAALVTKDVYSLPNRASVVVEACTNNSSGGRAVITCAGTYGSVTPPADPEPGNYVSASVDVEYTYQPPIPLWSLPGLNIQATLPSTTIHRRTVMRVLN